MATKSRYQLVLDAAINERTLRDSLNKASKNLDLKVKIDDASVKNFAKSLSKAYDSMEITFNAANTVFRETVDIISRMSEEVIALDNAVTEMKKVTNLSGQALTDYTNQLGDLGQTVARTKTEMIEASTEFLKSGYTEEQSATLGQLASMYQNIADEQVAAGDAASFLISQMIAFNIEAEDAISILDATNEVANSFAVSSGDLSKALGIVASTSSAMGNSMSETLGLTKLGQ